MSLSSQVMEALQPLVLTLIAAGVSYACAAIRTHLKSKWASDALQGLTAMAGVCVANAYQTVVTDLKDPSKPGVWNKDEAMKVKDKVLGDLKVLGASFVQQALAHGAVTSDNVDKLLNQFIESAVTDLKGRVSMVGQLLSVESPTAEVPAAANKLS